MNTILQRCKYTEYDGRLPNPQSLIKQVFGDHKASLVGYQQVLLETKRKLHTKTKKVTTAQLMASIYTSSCIDVQPRED